MSTVIRSLMVKVGADLTDMQKGMKQTSKMLNTAGKNLTTLGGTLTKGLTVPIAGAIAGLGALVVKSTAYADSIQTMADVTGLSAERLQELQYIGAKLDVELETLTGAQTKLTKAMWAAKDGTGSQSDAFKMLGISVLDSNGQMRDAKDVMMEAFTALNGVGNETERDALAMQIFGKSAMQLNPLIKTSAENIEALRQEAHNVGAVLSNETILAMDAFDDNMAGLKLSMQGVTSLMVANLLPTLNQLFPIIQNTIIPAVGNFVQKVADLIIKFNELDLSTKKMIGVLAGVAIGVGPAMSALGNLALGASSLIKLFSTLAKVAIPAATATAGVGTAAAAANIAMLPILGTVGLLATAFAGVALAISDAKGKLDEWKAAGGFDNNVATAKLNNLTGTKGGGLSMLHQARGEDVTDGSTNLADDTANWESSTEDLRRATAVTSSLSSGLLTASSAATSLGDTFSGSSEKIKTAAEQIQEKLDGTMNSLTLNKQIAEENYNLMVAKLGETATAADLSKARIAALTTEMSTQKQIVDAVQAAYNEMVAATGASSDASKELELQLAQETTAYYDLKNAIDETIESQKSLANSFASMTASEQKRLSKTLKESDQSVVVNSDGSISLVDKPSSSGLKTVSGKPSWQATSSDPVASYAVGTPYVPQDMLAMIHKGEAIIPASENKGGGSNTTTNYTYITIDADKNYSKVVDLVSGLKQATRQGVTA